MFSYFNRFSLISIDLKRFESISNRLLVVLGIDPGCRVTGYAVLTRKGARFQLLEAGIIKSNTKADMQDRLLEIHTGLSEVIAQFKPSSAGIESVFHHHSSESTIRLGQARGVALLALAQHKIPSAPYNPMTVKKSVGGHGRASKNEMIRIVTRLLGLSKDLRSDAADAAAIAITHLMHSEFQRRLK